MGMLAIILGDGTDFHARMPLPVAAAAVLAPILTLVGCVLVAKNRRLAKYSYALAGVVGALLLLPLFEATWVEYRYGYGDIALFSFLVGFPFAATAATAAFLKKPRAAPKPEPGPETTA